MDRYYIHSIHILASYDHKQMMLLRLEYLRKAGFLREDEALDKGINDLIDQTLKLRNLCLKYSLTQTKDFSKAIALCKEIKELDIAFTSKLLAGSVYLNVRNL